MIDLVKEHISSYPVVDSHYCRANTSRKYLELGLSIPKMFKQYVEWIQDRNINLWVSEKFYEKIFKEDFNYGFYIPKKDR